MASSEFSFCVVEFKNCLRDIGVFGQEGWYLNWAWGGMHRADPLVASSPTTAADLRVQHPTLPDGKIDLCRYRGTGLLALLSAHF